MQKKFSSVSQPIVKQPDMKKSLRMVWRLFRNFVCLVPIGRRLLFPSRKLADHFGPRSANYAIQVFLHHYKQLNQAGFQMAKRVLEIGPGQNLGTSLIIWALLHVVHADEEVHLTLWDRYPNMIVNQIAVKQWANAILSSVKINDIRNIVGGSDVLASLDDIQRGAAVPDIRYLVGTLLDLSRQTENEKYSLIYSHAAIEHIWEIERFWPTVSSLTEKGGWHSHRIDLADHGSRDSNYLEMLEWSPFAYWATMRFVPGAINRWRACMHLDAAEKAGLRTLYCSRVTALHLPTTQSRIHKAFRHLSDEEMRTTALDSVAIKST